MKTLYLIPARGGSKGIPGKNLKLFAGKPLISYSIELARQFASDDNICLSTDDTIIAAIAEGMGLVVPFLRPSVLASDTASTNDVILHAINYYESLGRKYDAIVLLQPTSPFRQAFHLKEALELYSENVDLVMSVKLTDANPYFVLFEENEMGLLEKSKTGNFTRRQDCPDVWQVNGAIYIYNVKSLIENKPLDCRTLKYVMESRYSVDLDTELDWQFAEFLNAEMKLL
ncbi:MAG: cytidylyltransferase domain-containing protein [Bacteroidales bacterium]